METSNINISALRSDLIDYIGSASSFMPYALIDVTVLETASDEEVIRCALRFGFNLDNYTNSNTRGR
jgi:hypothetical protein